MPSSVTSDRDYLELVSVGDTTINVNTNPIPDSDAQAPQTGAPWGGPTDYGGGQTITHSIGSIPIVRTWFDSDKNGRLYNTIRWTTAPGGVTSPPGQYVAERPNLTTVSNATTTKLLVNSPVSDTAIPVHYRIYRFGTKSFTSDERIDKIFDKQPSIGGTVGAAAFSDEPVATDTTVAHGQGEQILWKLQFSINQTDWYDEGVLLIGAPDTSTGPPGGPYTTYYYHTAYGSADATNFYIKRLHNYASSQTIYVRYVWEYKG